MELANNTTTHPQVQAITYQRLKDLKMRLLKSDASEIGREMVRRIDRFFEHPEEFKSESAPTIPDGSPIGSGCEDEMPIAWK